MAVSPFARDGAFDPERDGVFDPEIIHVMTGAYEELLGDLRLADRSDPFTEIVAKEVIRAAQLGVRDVAEMHQRVLGTLCEPQQSHGP
jgi:hypothetical protein